MRVVEVARFGGPEVLEMRDYPDPVPGPGQVLVEVSASDVLFLDTQIRAGWGEAFGVTPPYVPGTGVAGEVVAAGAGVDSAWIGRSVVTDTAAPGPQGGYAERAVADVGQLVAVPESLDLLDALALLHDGPTALTLVRNAGIAPGEYVLVTGAAGGLGLLLVQLAAAAGAHVIAAARGERKLDLAKELGAAFAVDYSTSSWTDQVRKATGGGGLDVVLDGVGGEIGEHAFDLVASGGRFSAHGAPSGSFALIDPEEAARRSVTLRGIEQAQFSPTDLPPLTAAALAEAAAAHFKPVIGQTFPLAQAREAHHRLESRSAPGKTLLLTSR